MPCQQRFNLGLEILLFDRILNRRISNSRGIVCFNLGLEILLFDRRNMKVHDVDSLSFNLGLEILLFDR